MRLNSSSQIFRLSTLTLEQRLAFVRRAICLFFLIGILLSFNLWTADRFFPLAPFIDGLYEDSTQLNALLLTILMFSLVASLFSDKTILGVLIICTLSIMLLQDQQRWQPWVYLYLLALLPFVVRGGSKQPLFALTCIQLVMIGIYLWSGIHKFNSNFIDLTFTNILKNFLRIENEKIIGTLKYGGYLVPVVEVLIAVCLAVAKFRNVGVVLAISLHSLILLYLSPSVSTTIQLSTHGTWP